MGAGVAWELMGVGARVDLRARIAWECIWAVMLLEPNHRRVQSLQEAVTGVSRG